MVLSIRRLRCADCKRIHHELPDILVPYKHHVRESIETTITAETQMSVIADESTLMISHCHQCDSYIIGRYM